MRNDLARAGVLLSAAAAVFVLGSCMLMFDEDHDDEGVTTCSEAIDKLYVNCGYYFQDALDDPFPREDAEDACLEDDVFSRGEWDCIRRCVDRNRECVGIAACIEDDCEIPLFPDGAADDEES